MDFEKLPDPKLPVWMNRGEPLTMAHASKTWWQRVYSWLTWPLAQIDVDTCDEQLLTLLAYQRDITRFAGETLAEFRLRVKWAFVNAQDAGFKSGFERIFQRLNIGQIQQLERQLWLDWDVILIRINDEQLSRSNTLMMALLRQYGRTCRRYFFDVINQRTLDIHAGRFDSSAEYHNALYVPTFELVRIHVNGWMASEFTPDTSFAGAHYILETQGNVGDITWWVDGPATITPLDRECEISVTGPGNISVTATDAMGRDITHRITPSLYFVQDGTKAPFKDFFARCARMNGREPTIDELSVQHPFSGSSWTPVRVNGGGLWAEWGDMMAYGWPGNWTADYPLAYPWMSASLTSNSYGPRFYAMYLAGNNNPAYNSSWANGGSVDISTDNANSFYHCAVQERGPLQITGFYINEFFTTIFNPTTSFYGATYSLHYTGHIGAAVSWSVTGNAVITNTGVVTITGPGPITVNAVNTRGETINHTINPTKYMIYSPAPLMTTAQINAWVTSTGGVFAGSEDLAPGRQAYEMNIRGMGTLWGEWGNMSIYGWPSAPYPGGVPYPPGTPLNTSWRTNPATSQFSAINLNNGNKLNLYDPGNQLRYATVILRQ